MDSRAVALAISQLQTQVRQLAQALADSNQAQNDALRKLAARTQRASATIAGPFAVGSVDVTIGWDAPWSDTGYGVYVSIISGTAALGSLDATLKVGSKTTSSCIVTVANTGAGPVGTFALDVLGVRT